MRDRYKEIGTIIVLLIPLLFLLADPYWSYISAVIYLFIFQGYIAWFLLFRCGQFFFGYSVTMGCGAYGTIVLTEVYNWPILLSALAGCIIAALAAVAVFFATIRTKGFYVGMVSFLLCLLFPMIVEGLRPITGGRSGLFFDGLETMIGSNGLYILIIVCTAVLVTGIFLFMRTKTGAILTLISENDELTQTVGINTTKYKALAYIIAGFMSGLGGVLYVNFNGAISSVDVDAFTTLYIYFIPLLGGRSVPYGPLIGAMIVKLTPELLSSVERYQSIIMGLIFVLVIVLLPDGLGPSLDLMVRKVWGRLRKTETFEKRSILFKVKEGENFNHRNTLK
ncbi:MAG: branched-chain amino acid ABC transporter permease, partial [Deltaproteobacteria bacterium]|nr:branched-chain amino acid ABC transporter permease [Deltaproteobacteria bacterium]MBW2031637.1 branched-chain amino acid ABC transporter permease [Deltaproteobacteria bacterium]MBW2109333.1 branched-chain amino acid ABC transporter permease [Deltaproteobacteria bacterium]